MHDLTMEIQKLFASSSAMRAIPITLLPDEFKAWVIRTNREYGVAIPVDESIQVSEKFSGARLRSEKMQIGEASMNLLMLTSEKENLRLEFSVICSQFVDPGEGGSNRELLRTNPHEWWEHWRSLLGNKYHEKTVHGLLGELVVYLILLERGESPHWTGASKSSVDFVTSDCDYEVKSTISRYESNVKISGQFQLERNGEKPLSLILCRFEPAFEGHSINGLVDRLVNHGIDRYELESELFDLGFEEGSSSRNRCFKLHEIRHYRIDDNFPGITLKSFKEERLPERVKHLSYTIDLTGIPYDEWNL
jgi:hypothetical protein